MTITLYLYTVYIYCKQRHKVLSLSESAIRILRMACHATCPAHTQHTAFDRARFSFAVLGFLEPPKAFFTLLKKGVGKGSAAGRSSQAAKAAAWRLSRGYQGPQGKEARLTSWQSLVRGDVSRFLTEAKGRINTATLPGVWPIRRPLKSP